MTGIEFEPWPKIARLFRDVVITEKIDGTNSAVGIVPYEEVGETKGGTMVVPDEAGDFYAMYAQSRTRIITPSEDNFGFARWVFDNASQLVSALGPGRHYGEWWGNGIQRGYGLLRDDKRWSLFNVTRHRDTDFASFGLDNVSTVPVLYEGPFTTHAVDHQVEILRAGGSQAAPGFMNPEGVITFHTVANLCFKTTLVGDEKPKGSKE